MRAPKDGHRVSPWHRADRRVQRFAHLELGRRAAGGNPGFVAALARVYATSGRESEARHQLAELLDMAKQPYSALASGGRRALPGTPFICAPARAGARWVLAPPAGECAAGVGTGP